MVLHVVWIIVEISQVLQVGFLGFWLAHISYQFFIENYVTTKVDLSLNWVKYSVQFTLIIMIP